MINYLDCVAQYAMLSALDTAAVIDDMDIPGYKLHLLKGEWKETWSITVNANWRLTFRSIDIV